MCEDESYTNIIVVTFKMFLGLKRTEYEDYEKKKKTRKWKKENALQLRVLRSSFFFTYTISPNLKELGFQLCPFNLQSKALTIDLTSLEQILSMLL